MAIAPISSLFLSNWYKYVGSRAGGFHEGDEAGVALDIARLRHEIDNVDNASGCDEASEWITRIVVDDKDWISAPSFGIDARRVLLRTDTKRILLLEKQIGELGLTDAGRIAQDRLEYGVQITGRARYDAQHFRGRCLRPSASPLARSACEDPWRRPTRVFAFVPVERGLRPPVRLFAPLRDKVTPAARRSGPAPPGPCT